MNWDEKIFCFFGGYEFWVWKEVIFLVWSGVVGTDLGSCWWRGRPWEAARRRWGWRVTRWYVLSHVVWIWASLIPPFTITTSDPPSDGPSSNFLHSIPYPLFFFYKIVNMLWTWGFFFLGFFFLRFFLVVAASTVIKWRPEIQKQGQSFWISFSLRFVSLFCCFVGVCVCAQLCC